MRQTVLFLALYVVGVTVCLGIGPRRYPSLCAALGLLIGLAAVVPPVLLLAALGVPYGMPLVATTAVAITALGVVGLRRRGWPTAAEARTLAAWTAGFLIVCLPLSRLNLAYLTFDSHAIIAMGRVLAFDGGFDHGLMLEMGDRGSFHIVAQATATLIGMDFLYALYPMLGLSVAAVFVVTLERAMRRLGVVRWRVALVALVVLTLCSVALFHAHFVYIHENLGSACYLFVFVALFWLAEVEDDVSLLPPAFIALTAFALHRIENPIVATLFLSLTVLPSRLPRRALLGWFGLTVAVIAGWYLILLVELPTGSDMKLGVTRCATMIAVPGALYLYWLASRLPLLARINRHAPPLAAVAVAGILALMVLSKPDAMLASARAMATNLRSFDEWGVTWYAIALLGVLGFAVERPPERRAFSYGLVLYLGFVWLISYEHGYMTTRTDSGMRMFLHVLPVAMFHVGLQLAMLFREAPAGAPLPAGTPAPG